MTRERTAAVPSKAAAATRAASSKVSTREASTKAAASKTASRALTTKTTGAKTTSKTTTRQTTTRQAAKTTTRQAAGAKSATRQAAGAKAATKTASAATTRAKTGRTTTDSPPTRAATVTKVAAGVGAGRTARTGGALPEGSAEASPLRASATGPGRRLISSSGRSASAGRIIGVGLICFSLWALLDANQLYRSEVNGGADGARRNVALAVLRPIAAVANAVHISGLVNWGDSVLNRNGGPGSNQGLPPPVTRVMPPPCQQTGLPNGTCYLPHGPHGRGVPLLPPPFILPPISQPTPASPLTIVDIGDSIGEDLGFGLGDLFSGDQSVHLFQEGVMDTGLVQSGYYNWPGHLQLYLNKYNPGAVIVMMGANDDQNMNVNGTVYTPLSTGWVKAYTARVDTLMEESVVAGAHVLWVGLPPMGGGNITNAFVKQVNTIYATQAELHQGVTYVPSWNVLAGPKGQFVMYLKIDGSEVAVRSSDGVHLDPAGWDLLAQALVKPMEKAWGINLQVAG